MSRIPRPLALSALRAVGTPEVSAHWSAGTFVKKVIGRITALGASLLIIACDSSITYSNPTPSSDEKQTIVVVEELQGANDSAPWWTHILLRKEQEMASKIPGNLLKLQGRGSVTAMWNGTSEVTIFIDDALFSQVPTTSTEMQGVLVTYRRASDRTQANSEQDCGGQPSIFPDSK